MKERVGHKDDEITDIENTLESINNKLVEHSRKLANSVSSYHIFGR